MEKTKSLTAEEIKNMVLLEKEKNSSDIEFYKSKKDDGYNVVHSVGGKWIPCKSGDAPKGAMATYIGVDKLLFRMCDVDDVIAVLDDANALGDRYIIVTRNGETYLGNVAIRSGATLYDVGKIENPDLYMQQMQKGE